MMKPPFSRRHLAIVLAVIVPFAVLPPLTAWSADRLAKAGAARWRALSSPLELALAAAAEDQMETSTSGGDPAVDAPQPSFTVARSSGEHANAVHARPRRIFVGPAMIQRAIPPAARPRSTWTEKSGDRPAGMLIQSPGALLGTILPGDVLFEAEGRPIASFEQLVSTVGQAYQRKAKYLSGRLYRKGETWSVTVEPGW